MQGRRGDCDNRLHYATIGDIRGKGCYNKDMNSFTNNLSLENISRLGEKYYLEELKSILEKENLGQYAVIDVEEKRYVVDADRFNAVEKARKDFGDEKLFYIVQIGMLQQSSVNYLSKKHAWLF